MKQKTTLKTKTLFLLLFTGFTFSLRAAQISPIKNGSWQDSSVWTNGLIPNSSDDVVIPEAYTIDLEGVIAVKSITVNGVLRAKNDADINLSVEWMLVAGSNALLEIGTLASPYTNKCTITLVGINDSENHGMGDKYIGAMGGGTIELHGEEKISWSHLGASTSIGTSQITMAEAVDWKAGDEIVVVSSRLDWNEAEKRTITGVNSGGLNLVLNNSLNYPHVGVIETYTRDTDQKTWTADLRAEVGLLTHNIKIEGDDNSEISGYGGHIMAMMNSTINASGIELYRMGQKGILGKYPWHWHLIHEFGKDQYFKNSSVHRSYNRAITIHGTSYVTVENNFFYDHIGHGVFLEDGTERYNNIKNNVTLLSKRPKPGEELTPSDNQMNEQQNRTPSSYWITNPNNNFRGNVAAGSEGTGYWFAFPTEPMGDSASDSRYDGIKPYKEPLGLFSNNKAHSCMSGFDIFDQLNSKHSIQRNGGWKNKKEHLIDNCTWYANDLGIYTGIGAGVGDKITYTSNLIFNNNVIVDNKINIMLASYSRVEKSVIVANSGNGIYDGATYGYRTYDGAGRVRNCHLVGWNGSNTSFIRNGGAATKHTNHIFSGITTDDNIQPAIVLDNYNIPISSSDFTPQSKSHARVWGMVLYDEDGSLSGQPESSIVSNHPMMLVGDEYQHSNWENTYRSPHKFALAIISFDGVSRDTSPNATCTRSKEGTPTTYFYDMYGFKDNIKNAVIVSEDFEYTYTLEELPKKQNVTLTLDDATIGDEVLFKFADFGKLGGLAVTQSKEALPSKNSLNELKNSNSTAYYVEANGDLYVKFIATMFNSDLDIDWTTDYNVPILDTDGDGVSDKDEIIAGSDPFSDAPAPPGPNLLTWGFNSGLDGWFSNTNNLSVSWNDNGYLDCNPVGNDPYVFNTSLQSFKTDRINYLEIRVKNETSQPDGALFVFSQSDPFFIPFTMTPNASDFETILIDLSTVANWSNNLNVNTLRIDPNGNGAPGTISFDHIYLMETDDYESLSSSKPIDKEMIVKLYPNPVQKGEDVTIELSHTHSKKYTQVTVYDLQGRTVISKEIPLTTTIKLPTNQLKEGLYTVRLELNESIETFKVLVK